MAKKNWSVKLSLGCGTHLKPISNGEFSRFFFGRAGPAFIEKFVSKYIDFQILTE